jgi:hypothetical protein
MCEYYIYSEIFTETLRTDASIMGRLARWNNPVVQFRIGSVFLHPK